MHQIGPDQNEFFLFYVGKVLQRGKVLERVPHHWRNAMTKLETLDGLVKICVDSAERYRRAAADVGKEKLVQYFPQQKSAHRSDAHDMNLKHKLNNSKGE